MPPPPCHCGRSRRRAIAAPVEATTGGIRARLEGVAVLACDAGHAHVVDQDLADRVRDALDRQVLTARRRRWRRDDACGACDAPLTLPGRTTVTPVVVAGATTVVTLVPTAEMVRCPACGREQWPPAVARGLHDLVPALVAEVGWA